MRAKDRIREALKGIMSDGEANACQIWRGYGFDRNRYGWFYRPFDGTDTYLGASLADALEWISQAATERAEAH